MNAFSFHWQECEAKGLQVSVKDAVKDYIKKVKVINPKPVHEGRITVLNEPPFKPHYPPMHSYN